MSDSGPPDFRGSTILFRERPVQGTFERPPPPSPPRGRILLPAGSGEGGGVSLDRGDGPGQPAGWGQSGLPDGQMCDVCYKNDRFYKVIFENFPGGLRAPETFILVMVYGDFLSHRSHFDKFRVLRSL